MAVQHGAGQMAFNATDRHPKRRRDLAVAQPLYPAQEEGGATLVGQFVQRERQAPELLAVAMNDPRIGIVVEYVVELCHIDPTRPFPLHTRPSIECDVPGCDQQVVSGGRYRLQLNAATDQTQEGILNHLLARAPVSHKPCGKPNKLAVVRAKQRCDT